MRKGKHSQTTFVETKAKQALQTEVEQRMLWRALITSWKCAWRFAYIWFGESQWLVLRHLISKYFWQWIMKPSWIYLSVIRLTTFRTLTILSFISYYKESNAATLPPKKVHHSLENHLTALLIFIMSQADTCKSLICVISLLQLHSHHYILS